MMSLNFTSFSLLAGFVKISAIFSFVGTCSKVTRSSFTSSLMKVMNRILCKIHGSLIVYLYKSITFTYTHPHVNAELFQKFCFSRLLMRYIPLHMLIVLLSVVFESSKISTVQFAITDNCIHSVYLW
jgi:hypothetical protein